ncbi:T9SS type A sorting domain-containing protein [Saccharicrinis sp. FJH2]|uniref:T9SS type A sorting domain-containing protein n=1 Tax=Saccharicrinis sp. FJH65 TaxID=3344659 RepID=UPI0035F3A487
MKRFSTFLFLFLAFVISEVPAQTPAFPGAEGGGMYTEGGRGGAVYFVTSLDDTNTGNLSTHEGTLRWCLGRSGDKTIIFKVGGIIELTSNLSVPSNTTIAGQTAPGDGILIKNSPIKVTSACLSAVTELSCPSFTIGGSNIIIRYIRIRPGDDIDNSINAPLSNIKFETDAIFGRRQSDIIIDHCSFGWGIDETASFYDNKNFTMQWCLVAESLRQSFHPKGRHGYGGIWGGKGATFHHNLLAHHDSRNPRMCGSRYSDLPDQELVDFRNNVIYNWGGNSGYAGEGGSYNFINNYYSYGAATSTKDRIFSPNADDGSNSQPAGVWGTFYVNGNYTYGYPNTTSNNWNGIDPNTGNAPLPGGTIDGIKSTSEFEVPYVTTHSAETAYDVVREYVGASHVRDAIDSRVINEVTNRLAPMRESRSSSPKPGFVDTPSDAGGYPTYSYDPNSVPVDSDRDGMPDDWENDNGLNKDDPTDRNTVGTDGYTMLEKYINSLVADNGPVPVQKVYSDPKGFSLYPNPASSEIHLTIPDYKSFVSYSISDISGKTVQKDQLTGELASKVSINALDRGIYFITISNGKQYITKRFVKQ